MRDYYLNNAGLEEFEDEDHDNDGVPNDEDAFPYYTGEWDDTDGDGLGDKLDQDIDGDGLPNTYEQANGFDPLLSDGALDFDHDGSTNLQEYQNGTNPLQLLSCNGSNCQYQGPPAPATISFPSPDTTSDAVAAIAGSFNVSNSGNAEYTIPLYVTPGTAGVAPKLALQYRSNGGDGLLGQGWSVGALSAISRCPQTRAQDGQATGLTFTASDRFCLDGERLVPVNPSATYGADGVEYRTEIDSFKKVISYGTTGTGPSYFKVWNKDGSVSEYGNTSDSQWKPHGSASVLIWAQNRIEDQLSYATSSNNPVIYTYTTTSAEMNISKIEYAYANGTTPNAEIEFTLQEIPALKSRVLLGQRNNYGKRLQSVTVRNRVGGNLIELRKYNFTYLADNRRNRTSKLASVTECRDYICLPATTFTWSDATTDYALTASSSLSGFPVNPFYGDPKFQRFVPTDFNGDGLTDLIYLEPSTTHLNYFYFKAAPSTGTTLGTATTQGAAQHSMGAWTVTDYNQDGYPDILFTTGGYLRLYLNKEINGQRSYDDTVIILKTDLPTDTEPNLNQTSWYDPKGVFADFNADGLVDLLYDKAIFFMEKDTSQNAPHPYKFGEPVIVTLGDPYTTGTLNHQIRLGIDSLPGQESLLNYHTVNLDSAIVGGDMNGDGLPDLIVDAVGVDDKVSVVLLNDGEGGFSYFDRFAQKRSKAGGNPPIYVADFNGDGLSDVLWFEYISGYPWHIRYSNGSGFLPAQPNTTVFATGQENIQLGGGGTIYKDVRVLDINQDGYPDFVYRLDESPDKIVVIFNDGRGSFPSGTTPFQLATTADANNFGNHFFADISGDGIVDWVDLYEKAWLGNQASGTAYNKITQITNGFGEEINIVYDQFSDPSVYVREFDAASLNYGAPVLDVFGAMTVVASVSRSSPTAEDVDYEQSTSYQYQGLKVQPAGRGWLGFRVMKIADDESGNIVSNAFRQDYPFIGALAETKSYVSGQTTALAETVNTYTKLSHTNGLTPPPYLVALTQSVTTQRIAESSVTANTPELTINGVLTTSTTSQSNFDSFGNAGTASIVITGDGSTHTTTTTSTYSNNTTDWLIGKLTQSVMARQEASSTITRTTAFTYDSYGRLLTEVREPQGSDAVKLTTGYEYDAFGNPNKITESAAYGSRYSRTVHDATGRFVDKTYNGLEQLVSEVTQRDAYGSPEKAKGLNGVEQYARYGTFGRQFFSASNNGSASTTQVRLCSSVSCPSGAVYRVQTTGTDGALANSYADKAGREVRTEIRSFSGTLSIADTQYDNSGRVKKVSVPYFSGDTVYWTTSSYDDLGRVIKVVDAQGGISTNAFSRYSNSGVVGVQQLSKNQLNQTKTTITNGRNQSIRVVDDLSGYINYTYDPAGNLIQLNANGVVSTIGYDILGRRTSLDDPDQGDWDYLYNAFGEMTDQQDSGGALTHIVFDALGRMIQRKDYKASMAVESDHEWTYGSTPSAHNVGQVVIQQDYVTGFIRTNLYDSLGRPQQTISSLGEDGVDGDFLEFASYDSLGRPYQVIDATGKGVQYAYNAYGYQEKLVEASNTSHVYHTITQTNARGQVTTESIYGTQFQVARSYDPETGLVASINATSSYGVPRTLLDIDLDFDAVGNLSSRTREVQAQGSLQSRTLNESFTYDQLNRLTAATATGQSTLSMAYDATGNITSKTGVGSYTYNSSRPHAVASVGGVSYTYDAIGNMTSGGGRTAAYNSVRKPTQITKGTHTTSFEYGPDRSHYKRVDNANGNITTTLNVGNVEFIQVGGEPMKTKRYIGGVMIVTDAGSTHEEHALLTDHLGSTVALAKADALTLEQMDYDAFGKRRDLWTLNELAAAEFGLLNALTTTGFTGHEMLDEVGLIHMQGRVYDPNLGRFMSADPYITELDNTQNMNRYSYVYNNPLTLVDPSGFSALTIAGLGGGIAAGSGVSSSPVMCPCLPPGQTTGPFTAPTEGAPSSGPSGVDTNTQQFKDAFSLEAFAWAENTVAALMDAFRQRPVPSWVLSWAQTGSTAAASEAHVLTMFRSIWAITYQQSITEAYYSIAGRMVDDVNSDGALDGNYGSFGLIIFAQAEAAVLAANTRVVVADGLEFITSAIDEYDIKDLAGLKPGTQASFVINTKERFNADGSSAEGALMSISQYNDSVVEVNLGALRDLRAKWGASSSNIVASTIGHELVHVQDLADNPYISTDQTEYNAYKWEFDNRNIFNMPIDAKTHVLEQMQKYGARVGE